jgi:DHA1 family bicyclomycin/chloramphenicol resistance-like MFS transporter
VSLAPARDRLGQGEFIALIAMLFATIALSIDAMLPALPEIAATLTPEAPNRAQLVVTSFVFGMGIGTLLAGPLSDAFGRKRVILLGSALYCGAALAAWGAESLEALLVARVVMGIGAAGPRAVSIAMVRDLFQGREMAKVMSFAMMVFTLVPAVAPLLGQGVIALAGWREIFIVYIGFAGVTMLWLGLRQPETLPVAARRRLSVRALWAGTAEVFRHRVVVVSILCQSLTLGALFATLSSIQGLFEGRYGRGEDFPLWFALIALVSAGGSFLNARAVMALGMRRMVTGAYAGVGALTLGVLGLVAAAGLPIGVEFGLFVLWAVALFAMMGLTMGNLNALAMEPLGHIAGLAASVISAVATVVSVLLAVPVGLMLDATPLPLLGGVAVFIAGALALMRRL